MRHVMAISAASTVLGYAVVHFAFFSNPAPQPPPTPSAGQPAEQNVLAPVVDVTDLDPLLDPPPVRAAAGEPFDPPEPSAPPSPASAAAPAPIPPAAD
jgi:hypothetical protein